MQDTIPYGNSQKLEEPEVMAYFSGINVSLRHHNNSDNIGVPCGWVVREGSFAATNYWGMWV
jgi:hypothetical protein